MELINYVITELTSNPEVILLLIGLFFVSLAEIIAHLPASKTETYNDKYTPTMSANNTKRKNRYH